MDRSEVARVERHLRRTFSNQSLNIAMPHEGSEAADVQVGEVRIGRLMVDDEEGDRSFNFEMDIPASSNSGPGIVRSNFAELEGLLRRIFGNHSLRIAARPKKTDSAEVYVGEEFIGVIYVEDEKGNRSFNFQMAILSEDLQD